MRDRRNVVGLMLGLTLLGASCAPAAKPLPSASPITPMVPEVTIQNFAFSPNSLPVKAGETITVTNKDAVGHSLTSDDGSSFDTRVLGNNQTGTITAPTKPGTYPFHCTPHPTMKGTLVVE